MQRAIRAGMPVEELETPILVIDLDIMERNDHDGHTRGQQGKAAP